MKLGIGQLPAEPRFSQVAGVGLLADISFTMDIFIAELGFRAELELLLMAKTGALLASLVAGIGGYMWLRAASNTQY